MKLDPEIINRQWERYVYSRDRGHTQFLAKADKCEKYFAGDQWEVSDLASLREQKRPALTVNKIMSTLASVMGEQIANRAEVLFRPASGSPPEVAEALTKVWMQIAQNNQLQWVRSDVFADGLIRGRGFYDVRLSFNDAMQGEVAITPLNSKNVLVDPDAEMYDPDTWNDVFVTKWMTPSDIAVLYDEEAGEYLKSDNSGQYPQGYDSIEHVRDSFSQDALNVYGNASRDNQDLWRNIRVIERQYKKLDNQQHFVDIRTGDMRPIPRDWDRNRIASVLERTGGAVSVVKKLVKRVRWTVTAGSAVLHDDWSPYQHFTPVPYFPYFRYGRTMGLVENLLGSQDLLNKTLSQELHILNTSANSGWKVRAGALTNMSIEELALNGAKTGLVVEVDDMGALEKIQPNQTPSGLDRVSYKAEEHIKSISGVSDSMMGFDRADVAAKAIAYKQQRGSMNFSKVMDNLERTDWLLARAVLCLVQGYYTEERVINITHDDPLRQPETMVVNQTDPQTGQIQNDLTLGEYDIVITSTPQRATLEDSQFEQARAMREIGVPIPDTVLVENSRLMRKAEIVKMMQGDQNSPQAQQQQQWAARTQEAQVAAAEADARKKQADTELSVARAQEVLSRVQQGDTGALEASIEEQQALREFELEKWKMGQEFDLKREQMEREFALKQSMSQQEMELRREAAALERQERLEKMEQERLEARVTAARAEDAAYFDEENV